MLKFECVDVIGECFLVELESSLFVSLINMLVNKSKFDEYIKEGKRLICDEILRIVVFLSSVVVFWLY